MVQLRQGGMNVPIYFIYAGPAELALARSIGGDHPVFGIEVPWPLEWKSAVAQDQKDRFPNWTKSSTCSSRTAEPPWLWNMRRRGVLFCGAPGIRGCAPFSCGGGGIDAVIVIDKWLRYPSTLDFAWRNLSECWTENSNDWSARSFERRFARTGMIVWGTLEIFAKRLGSSLWLRPNMLTSFSDQEGIPLRWKLIERLYIEIERHHRLEPLDCRGIVIRSEFLDRHSALRAKDEYLGWEMLFKRGLEAMSVSSNHFSMVREHGHALAQLIGRAARNQDGDWTNSLEP